MFAINGIVNILKPPGMTSFDVVASLRGIFKMKKIGHTGTLDPGAVGVLPVCIGSATKAIEYLTEKDKVYRAEMTLGATTDTQDSTGEVTGRYEINVSQQNIIEAVNSFIGKYDQIPPMFSAVKVKGKKLYELAREGITVERKARRIEIYSIDIIHIDMGDIHSAPKVLFDVSCSKGTYIRTLCADIGEKLGCGAHMSFLLRTKAGNFDIASAYSFEQLALLRDEGRLNETLIGVDAVFSGLKHIALNSWEEKRILNGASISLKGDILKTGEVLRLYNESSGFIALGEVVLKEGNLELKSKKIF